MIGKRKTGSDGDKAIARAGHESTKETRSETPSNISTDTILAEKDEVKMAEERLRKKNK